MATVNATDIYAGDFQAGTAWNQLKAITDAYVTLTAGYKYNNKNCVTVIKFTTASACTSFTLSMCAGSNANSYAATLRYKVTSAEDTSLQNATSDTAGDGSFTVKTGNYTRTTVTISKSLSAGTHYVYLWTDKTTSYPSNYYQFLFYNNATYGTTVTYEEVATYALTTSVGTGSTITVNRTSSSIGSTGTLTNGASIYAGDVLKITFSAKTGYNLMTHTVNGSSFTSGGTHTVSGNVTVVSVAALMSFLLSISAGSNSTVSVNRTSTNTSVSTGALTNGATIYYGDVLLITFGANTGYKLTTHTVNGATFTSGDSHTVTSAVTVTAIAAPNVPSYQMYIDDGTEWCPVLPLLDLGDSWSGSE